ncbi:MAG: HPr family phosphocarrier protein [Clostridiaceae bacterium]|jgi:phosphocarrier protein HPr|nr:HPr family phosphocarrier protein [Clostridiaceae bacterium]
MVSREVTISSKTGLESKMAAKLIQKASEYESNIWIQKEERKANAKSLLGLLSLGISPGDRITIITDGRDEETALNELEAFAEKGMTD